MYIKQTKQQRNPPTYLPWYTLSHIHKYIYIHKQTLPTYHGVSRPEHVGGGAALGGQVPGAAPARLPHGGLEAAVWMCVDVCAFFNIGLLLVLRGESGAPRLPHGGFEAAVWIGDGLRLSRWVGGYVYAHVHMHMQRWM